MNNPIVPDYYSGTEKGLSWPRPRQVDPLPDHPIFSRSSSIVIPSADSVIITSTLFPPFPFAFPRFCFQALSSGPHPGDARAESPISCRIMALDLQPPDGRKRVKVYELRDNDWFDRGTGFCTGTIMGVSYLFLVPACAVPVATATSRRVLWSHSVFPPRHRHPSLTRATLMTGGTANIRRIGGPAATRLAGDQDHQGRWLSKTARFLSHHLRLTVSPERNMV